MACPRAPSSSRSRRERPPISTCRSRTAERRADTSSEREPDGGLARRGHGEWLLDRCVAGHHRARRVAPGGAARSAAPPLARAGGEKNRSDPPAGQVGSSLPDYSRAVTPALVIEAPTAEDRGRFPLTRC